MQKMLGAHMVEGYGQTECPCAFLFGAKTYTNFGNMPYISVSLHL